MQGQNFFALTPADDLYRAHSFPASLEQRVAAGAALCAACCRENGLWLKVRQDDIPECSVESSWAPAWPGYHTGGQLVKRCLWAEKSEGEERSWGSPLTLALHVLLLMDIVEGTCRREGRESRMACWAAGHASHT